MFLYLGKLKVAAKFFATRLKILVFIEIFRYLINIFVKEVKMFTLTNFSISI